LAIAITAAFFATAIAIAINIATTSDVMIAVM
jgi:hypothetical protein